MSFSSSISTLLSFPCLPNKRPQIKDWTNISASVAHRPGSAYGLLCGSRNGLLVIDCDLLKKDDPEKFVDGVVAWRSLIEKYGENTTVKNTPHVRTQSGGLHVYFAYDAEVGKRRVQGLSGALVSAEHASKKIKIDVLADKSFVVAVGSPGYTWLTPDDEQKHLQPLPLWLKKILVTADTASVSRKRPAVQQIYPDDQQPSTSTAAPVASSAFSSTPKRCRTDQVTSLSASNVIASAAISKFTLKATVESLDHMLASSYDSWSQVLWAIHTTAQQNGYDAFDLADSFSRQCTEKYVSSDDVRCVYEQANGAKGYGYLVTMAKTRTSNLDAFTRLVQEKMENPPPKITKLVRENNDQQLIAPDENLTVFTNWGTLCTYPERSYLNHLTEKVEIPNALDSIHKKFTGACQCHFIDQSTVRYIVTNGQDAAGPSFDLRYPYDEEHRYIRTESKTITNKKHISLLLRETAVACRKFLSQYLGFSLRVDHLTVNTLHVTNDNTMTSIGCDEVGRSHEDYIRSLFAAVSCDTFREKYRYAGDRLGIYVCDDETHCWRRTPNQVVEKDLIELLRLKVKDLEESEHKTVGKTSHIKQIRERFESYIYDYNFLQQLDTKRELFVLDNGCFDFTDACRGVWRNIQYSDYVSLTAGWAYNEEESATYMPAVVKFFEEILPRRDERNYVLHYFSRVLRGFREEKEFLVLTDKRAGFNGKTTMMALLQQVLGPYATTGTKIVCQSSMLGDRNSHDGGLFSLKGRRLVVADELKKNMSLDCGWLKAVTGGEYFVNGRMMYSSESFRYDWQAGIVIIFNENDYPKFDPSDEAFMARMVVCPFRSKFVKTAAATFMEENTFVAKRDINKDFPMWRSAVLDLLRQHSNAREFGDIPSSMNEWKEEICDHNDAYSAWMDENLQKSDNTDDYVSLAQVFDALQRQYTHQKLDKREINGCMKQWATRNQVRFVARHRPWVNGRQLQIYNVLCNIRQT